MDSEINKNEQHDSERNHEYQRRRHKLPSKQIRDLRRLLMFKCRIKNNMKVSQSTQTDNTKTNSKWKFWRRSPTERNRCVNNGTSTEEEDKCPKNRLDMPKNEHVVENETQ